MGSNGKRRREQAERERTARTQARRDWLRRVMLTGLTATFLLFSSNHIKTDRERGYQRFYDENIRGIKANDLEHPDFIKQTEPAEEEKRILKLELEKKLGKDIRIVSERFYQGQVFKELKVREEVWSEYERRALKNTTNFFAFLGLANEIPNVKVERLQKDTKLLAPTKELVPVYVVLEATEPGAIGEIVLNTAHGLQNIRLLKREFVAGSIDRKYSLNFTPERFDISWEESPIIISAGFDPISSYWAIPCEVLHHHLAMNTLRFIGDNIRASAKEGEFTSEKYNKIQEKAINLEEGLVHGASEIFVEKNEMREGFRRLDVDTLFRRLNGSEGYGYVSKVKELMERKGCRDVFQSARTNYDLMLK